MRSSFEKPVHKRFFPRTIKRRKKRQSYGHIRRNGVAKRCYTSEQDAKEAAALLDRDKPLWFKQNWDYYLCDECPSWHVGRPPLPRITRYYDINGKPSIQIFRQKEIFLIELGERAANCLIEEERKPRKEIHNKLQAVKNRRIRGY